MKSLNAVRNIIVAQIIIGLMSVSLWCLNLYKFRHCDFEAPYRCEVTHGVGLVTPAFIVTAWFNSDK